MILRPCLLQTQVFKLGNRILHSDVRSAQRGPGAAQGAGDGGTGGQHWAPRLRGQDFHAGTPVLAPPPSAPGCFRTEVSPVAPERRDDLGAAEAALIKCALIP